MEKSNNPAAKNAITDGSQEKFTKNDRLRKKSEFDAVYRRRISVADSRLILVLFFNSNGLTRLGLSVSKKVGKANRRNLWKRRIREVFRRNRLCIPSCFDYIVIPKFGFQEVPSLEEIKKSFLSLVLRAERKIRRCGFTNDNTVSNNTVSNNIVNNTDNSKTASAEQSVQNKPRETNKNGKTD